MNMYNPNFRPGYLEVFVGPMKSGKTLKLIHRVEKLKYMTGFEVIFIKPKTDTRDVALKSRFSGNSYDCIFVENSKEILEKLDGQQVVVIDEAQFFDNDLPVVVNELLDMDLNVIVAGLDLDFRGEPFGSVPAVLALANRVVKLSGICDFPDCNNPARFTQRMIDGEPAKYDSPLILIDSYDNYETRCRKHHEVPK